MQKFKLKTNEIYAIKFTEENVQDTVRFLKTFKLGYIIKQYSNHSTEFHVVSQGGPQVKVLINEWIVIFPGKTVSIFKDDKAFEFFEEIK